MLHIHRAERSDRLVAALADILAGPSADPLTPEVVAVHSRGIERWISQELAMRLGTATDDTDGVCANVSFPFPGRLVRDVVARASAVDPEQDPWLPDRLTWPLLELVAEVPDDPMLGPLRLHVAGGDEGATRRLGAIRHVADLFDRYGVHRPGMILRWRAGEPVGPDGGQLAERQRWQPALWGAIRERIGLPSFAERRSAALEALTADPDLLDLPPRLTLFGLTALPATYLEVLAAVAHDRDVHLMLLHPSDRLWRRIEPLVRDRGHRLWLRDEDPTSRAPVNPLLRSWGRDARELQLTAPEPDATHAHLPDDRDASGTLLERVQADIHADRAPGTDGTVALDPVDRSIQVHDCHGRIRQVEVLRDAILHLLSDRPDLEPRDVIVMCPDIETFAPLVTAVFGADAIASEDRGGAGSDVPPALRLRLADRSIRRTNPVLEVVALVLDLVGGRVTASSVIDLLSREPVRRRFRLDEDEVEQLESWIVDLQIRWGLDADHRRRQGLPEIAANTWRAGLQRLQLGIAMADEDHRLVGGVAPFDGVEGQASDLAGKLVECIDRLAVALEEMAAPRTLDAWREVIGKVADHLTDVARDAAWQELQLHRILDDLVGEATGDGGTCGVPLDITEIRTLLSERLVGRPTTSGHRTGDLTFCTLVPMRSVPHRVVCLLGMDDGAFPRQAVPDSDDLLLAAPRIGDRDPRSEDRQLLLDALLAATETLVITYSGRDVRTNELRPPAVPVDELLDVIDRTATTPDGRPAREQLTVRHPLGEHDPRNFVPGALRADDRPWGFHPETLEAARAQRTVATPPQPFLARELALPVEDTIDLDDLVAFLQHPVKAFCTQRLEITLRGEGNQPSDSLPATLQGLDAWKVGQGMLEAWLDGESLGRAEEVLRARGLVPPGALAASELRNVRDRLDRILLLCGQHEVEPARKARSVDIQVALPDGRTLVGTVADVHDWRVESIAYSSVAPKHRLAAWARFLAVNAEAPGRPWAALTLGRGGNGARCFRLGPLGASEDEARATVTRHLVHLVDLYDRGRRSPIPLYCEASAKIADNLHRDRSPTAYVGRDAWETNPYGGYEREDLDPYHVAVLGGQVPTQALFEAACRDAEEAGWVSDDVPRVVAYAWRLWEPILALERRSQA